MRSFLNDLGLWFWRLVPANPILVRVVYAGGRRPAHLWIRAAYLFVLAAVVVFGIVLTQSAGASLASLAKQASRLFEIVALIQLGMVCVLAPIFAAAAITQEKDSQTFSILLSTPLTSGQIVLGSLLSRLYFVMVLLLASLPLFCIMMVYGGVTFSEIFLSLAVAAATATVTAAIAIAISVMKVGTGRTIFSFYLTIALYLLVLWSLATVPAFIPPEAPPSPAGGDRMSWLAAFHPFLAMRAILSQTPVPDAAAVAHYGFPRAQWLARPAYSYIVMCSVLSLLVVLASVAFVRRGAKLGEPTLLGRLFGSARTGGDSEITRRPRHVWANPVAWREAKTRAAAGSGGAVRWLVIGAGIVAAVALDIMYLQGLSTADTRAWLKGLLAVELGLALFIATATAATSMTREKEGDTLDLLLTTPLQSSQIIFGKIRGLVSFAAPMLAVPSLTLLLFVLTDLLRGRLFRSPGPVVYLEALVAIPLLVAAFTVFACAWGLRSSVKARRTLASVLFSVGFVMFVFGMAGLCAFGVQGESVRSLAAVLAPFCPLSGVMAMLDPEGYYSIGVQLVSADEVKTLRGIVTVAALIACAGYILASVAIHRDVVRNFDMTIRKQSA